MEPNHAGVRFIGPPRAYGTAQYPKRYILVHNTANDATAVAEANYARTRTDGTSSHYYVDKLELIQSLNTRYGANHVGSPTGNRYAISYEITGTNGKDRSWWLLNVDWAELAKSMAADAKDWDIPPRLLTVAQMRDGVSKGFCTHDMARQAWGGTTHTDPGPGFPMDHLLELVEDNMADFQTSDHDDLVALASRVLSLITLDPSLVNKRVVEAGKLESVPLIDAVKRIDAQTKTNGAALSALNAKVDQLLARPAGTVTQAQVVEALHGVTLTAQVKP